MLTRRQSKDLNNNNNNNDNNNNISPASIDIDGSNVVVGDIVYIKSNRANFVTTPFIIEKVDVARVCARNLIDQQVKSLGSENFTTKDSFSAKSIFDVVDGDTLTLYRQYRLRQTIVPLVKSIKHESRVMFCSEMLPKMKPRERLWETTQKSTIDNMKKADAGDFDEIHLRSLHLQLKNIVLKMTKEENDDIAKMFAEVCVSCFSPNDLIQCNGRCKNSFHQHHIDKWSINSLIKGNKKKSQRTSKSGFCLDCTSSKQNKNGDHSICMICEEAFESNEVVSCIACSNRCHSTCSYVSCITLISKSQMICRDHEVKEKILESLGNG